MSLWLSTYRNALEYRAKYPASIHVVEFESLVQDVPGCMRKLCGILGLEFSESLCVPTFNRMPIESDSSFGAKEGIDASAVDRSGHVADEEKQTVFKLAGDVYDGLKSVALK